MLDWAQARDRLGGPIFAPLAPALERLPRGRWPDLSDLNAATEGIATARGMPVRFVAPRERTDRERLHYELRIAATGEVETRAGNWHDLFNALAWITFPKAKAAINAQHAAILEERGMEEAQRRGPERDVLTLFDEGGVVVAASAPEMLRLIVEHRWKELFWERRAELPAKLRFLAFGHGLFEKALAPHVGMVGKTVFVPVGELFFMLPGEAQVREADALLAAHFASRTRFDSPRRMAPLPVLGVPGWHPDTAREAFYDDASYFQPRPGGARA